MRSGPTSGMADNTGPQARAAPLGGPVPGQRTGPVLRDSRRVGVSHLLPSRRESPAAAHPVVVGHRHGENSAHIRPLLSRRGPPVARATNQRSTEEGLLLRETRDIALKVGSGFVGRLDYTDRSAYTLPPSWGSLLSLKGRCIGRSWLRRCSADPRSRAPGRSRSRQAGPRWCSP